jgi:hypothetical protein
MKFLFTLLIISGCIGILGVLLFCIATDFISLKEYITIVFLALLSMVLMLFGVYGCNDLKRREKP